MQAKTEPASHPTVSQIASSNSRTSSSPSVITEQATTLPNDTAASQTVTTTSAAHTQQNSLVVSVPLANTSLSPIANPSNASSLNSQTGLYQHLPERIERSPQQTTNTAPPSGALHSISSTSLDSTMVSSEGGLKIAYEKQPTANSSSLSRISTATPPVAEETPAKRARSQSADKTDKIGKNRKRGNK